MRDVSYEIQEKLNSLSSEEKKALSDLLGKCEQWGGIPVGVMVRDFSEQNIDSLICNIGRDNLVGLHIEEGHIVKASFSGCGGFNKLPEELKYFGNLRELYLVYVDLYSLKELKEYCPQLEKLYLGPNPIRKLKDKPEIVEDIEGHGKVRLVFRG